MESAGSLATTKDQWSRNLDSEVQFWEEWFSTRGAQWPEDYRTRLDPQKPVEADIAALLSQISEAVVRVIDVGAGPITRIGYVLPGKDVLITAVDALAVEYDKIMARNGVAPPVRTQLCDGEALVNLYQPNTFDLAVATNSLDHAYEPNRIIENMVRLVKPGRSVYLRHARNEGVNEHYVGLHQWNFDVSGGEPVIWSKTHRYNIVELLRGKADVSFEAGESWVQIWAKKC